MKPPLPERLKLLMIPQTSIRLQKCLDDEVIEEREDEEEDIAKTDSDLACSN